MPYSRNKEANPRDLFEVQWSLKLNENKKPCGIDNLNTKTR